MPISLVLARQSAEFEDIVRTVRRARDSFRLDYQASNLPSAVRSVRRHPPDILLMEVKTADLPTLRIIHSVSSGQRTRVVVLCQSKDAGAAVEALEAGAAGYLFAGTAPDDVLRLLRLAAVA